MRATSERFPAWHRATPMPTAGAGRMPRRLKQQQNALINEARRRSPACFSRTGSALRMDVTSLAWVLIFTAYFHGEEHGERAAAHTPCPDGGYLLFIDNEHCGSHLLPKPRRMHKRKDGRKSSSRPRCPSSWEPHPAGAGMPGGCPPPARLPQPFLIYFQGCNLCSANLASSPWRHILSRSVWQSTLAAARQNSVTGQHEMEGFFAKQEGERLAPAGGVLLPQLPVIHYQ